VTTAAPPVAAPNPVAATAAVRRVAHVLEFGAPKAVRSAGRSSQLLAAAALLLLVVAGLSVLRLSRRMSGEMLWGRPG
jgi:hypothetical protein